MTPQDCSEARNAELLASLDRMTKSFSLLAQAIEHQAAAIAELVEEIAARAEEEPDDGIPQSMSTKR